MFDALLSTVNTQIAAADISVPTLTIDNYAEVLNGVIITLDETAIYNQPLSQVTTSVENNRPLITERVTSAVREQVAAQVIPVETGNTMTKETYDAAVAAGQIDSQTQAAIESAIESQIQSRRHSKQNLRKCGIAGSTSGFR